MSETDSPTTPPATPARRWWRFGETRLDPRRNGLNLIRLILAATVLVAHGWYISGKGIGPALNGENMGGWAVFGFFAISGYLITGSRLTNSVGTYLVHRFARIFPAFLVCLVVTAFVFAPISYYHEAHTLSGFFTTATTPVNYVLVNAGLKILSYNVAATPTNVPYPSAWDGSLWSLYYEFVCYLIIGLLFAVGFVRRHVGWIVGAFAFAALAYAGINRLAPITGNNGDLLYLTKLLPFFLAGGALYMLRDRIPLTWPFAVLSLAVSAFLVLHFTRYGPQFAAPFLAYAILWFGAVLPCPNLVRRHDVSYGVYIYAFPTQQLFAVAGVATTLPLLAFDALALLATLPLAAASWLLVERPVMRLARRATRRTAAVEPVPTPERTVLIPATPLAPTGPAAP